MKQIKYHVIETDKDIVELAGKFIDFGVLCEKSFDDCQHIAAAILAGCDVIISWNFKHIVNVKTVKGVKIITTMEGYKDLLIYTIITNGIAANSIIPPNVEALRQEAVIIQKEMPEYSVDHVMMLLMVESLIGPYLERQPEVMEFFMNWIAAESRVFDVKEFNKNP